MHLLFEIGHGEADCRAGKKRKRELAFYQGSAVGKSNLSLQNIAE
jgi:hypothetical protein